MNRLKKQCNQHQIPSSKNIVKDSHEKSKSRSYYSSNYIKIRIKLGYLGWFKVQSIAQEDVQVCKVPVFRKRLGYVHGKNNTQVKISDSNWSDDHAPEFRKRRFGDCEGAVSLDMIFKH